MPALTMDWSKVDLTNLPGKRTWPMTLPTMMYVPTDVTAKPLVGRLLKALVTHLLSDEVQGMLPRFGYAPLPKAMLGSVRAQADASITADPNMPAWRFETNATEPGVGIGNFVLSSKRGSWLLAETLEIQDTQELLNRTRQELAALRSSSQADARVLKGVAGTAFAIAALTGLGMLLMASRMFRRRRQSSGFHAQHGASHGNMTGVPVSVSKTVDEEAQAVLGGLTSSSQRLV